MFEIRFDFVLELAFSLFIRISSPDLPGVSDPTADGGCALRAASRNCIPAAAKSWTIPASRRPMDHRRQAPRGAATKAGWPPSRDAGRLKDDADRRDHIVDLPTAARIVGVNAPRHAENAGDMLRAEGEMKPIRKSQKCHRPSFLLSIRPIAFGIPVINGGKDREQQDRRSTRNESAPPRSRSRSIASRTAPPPA